MAWGYRLEVIGAREGARCREDGRTCSAPGCGVSPQYMSAYRYTRSSGTPVTATRALCIRHARLFSMKYSLAWPDMLRRVRRPISVVWAQLAA